MKRLFSVFVLLAAAAPARADMIEVRGRGIMNGKILSQNEREMRFKDASGETQTFARKDVLFAEAEKEPTLAEKFKNSLQLPSAKPRTAPAAVKPPAAEAEPEAPAGGPGSMMVEAMRQAALADKAVRANNARIQREIAAAEGGYPEPGGPSTVSHDSTDYDYRPKKADYEGDYRSL